jgi:hypothetical protein
MPSIATNEHHALFFFSFFFFSFRRREEKRQRNDPASSGQTRVSLHVQQMPYIDRCWDCVKAACYDATDASSRGSGTSARKLGSARLLGKAARIHPDSAASNIQLPRRHDPDFSATDGPGASNVGSTRQAEWAPCNSGRPRRVVETLALTDMISMAHGTASIWHWQRMENTDTVLRSRKPRLG